MKKKCQEDLPFYAISGSVGSPCLLQGEGKVSEVHEQESKTEKPRTSFHESVLRRTSREGERCEEGVDFNQKGGGVEE